MTTIFIKNIFLGNFVKIISVMEEIINGRVELKKFAHNKLLQIQLDRKLNGEKNISITSISSDVVNTVLQDEELLKKVLEKMNDKKE